MRGAGFGRSVEREGVSVLAGGWAAQSGQSGGGIVKGGGENMVRDGEHKQHSSRAWGCAGNVSTCYVRLTYFRSG